MVILWIILKNFLHLFKKWKLWNKLDYKKISDKTKFDRQEKEKNKKKE